MGSSRSYPAEWGRPITILYYIISNPSFIRLHHLYSQKEMIQVLEKDRPGSGRRGGRGPLGLHRPTSSGPQRGGPGHGIRELAVGTTSPHRVSILMFIIPISRSARCADAAPAKY